MSPTAFTALLEAFSEPVLVVRDDGTVETANNAALDLFGKRILGAQLRALMRQPEVTAMLERMIAGDETGSAPYATSDSNNERSWKVTARRMDTRAFIVSLRDTSELEAAETQRRDFVANVSHELRSPLTVLAGFLETLQGAAAEDPQARAEFLAIMQAETERMTGLVADLLSLSRVEASARIRPRDPVAMDMVVNATLAALRPQIEQAGLKVTCDLPDPLPPVPGDYDQLVQVYHNLVENALKYGGDGDAIDITGVIVPRLPGFEGPALRISIRDHGEGVDPIHIPRLTERFYRVDRARSRESGGTGLGLAIVKHILGRHRGRLVIRSHPGEGSTFETILPLS
ncbi:MAG: PAS domain-containing protein [Alphaproteobacteria bacterium]|jgi:two-component system phosphate regulon sensor histidine kinase PhoR|nr:PAS domain-containing protein [Alphaproteobacteria bacterium]